MPDCSNWSPSMLLRWVLTRDSDAVLSMLARWLIEGDDVTQIRPETWDDVLRTYCVDDSLPKGDGNASSGL